MENQLILLIAVIDQVNIQKNCLFNYDYTPISEGLISAADLTEEET